MRHGILPSVGLAGPRMPELEQMQCFDRAVGTVAVQIQPAARCFPCARAPPPARGMREGAPAPPSDAKRPARTRLQVSWCGDHHVPHERPIRGHQAVRGRCMYATCPCASPHTTLHHGRSNPASCLPMSVILGSRLTSHPYACRRRCLPARGRRREGEERGGVRCRAELRPAWSWARLTKLCGRSSRPLWAIQALWIGLDTNSLEAVRQAPVGGPSWHDCGHSLSWTRVLWRVLWTC